MNTRIIVQLDDKYYEVPRALAEAFVGCAGAIREVHPIWGRAHQFQYCQKVEKYEVDITISIVAENQVIAFVGEENENENDIPF